MAGEIDVSGIDMLDGADEFLRMWSKPGSGVACVIEPRALAPDPFLFGMAMVDAIRHAARAWSQVVDVGEEDALARIFEGFDAERGTPTSGASQVTGTPN